MHMITGYQGFVNDTTGGSSILTVHNREWGVHKTGVVHHQEPLAGSGLLMVRGKLEEPPGDRGAVRKLGCIESGIFGQS